MTTSRTAPPPRKGFLDLPPELIHRIVRFALPSHAHDGETFNTRNRVLRSLCLVSKLARDIAQPELFRRVYVDSGWTRDAYMKARSKLRLAHASATSIWYADGSSSCDDTGERAGKDLLRLLKVNKGLKELEVVSRGDAVLDLNLGAISRLVKDLEDLVITTYRVVDSPDALAPTFRHLRRLVLQDPWTRSPSRLGALPNLTSLGLCNVAILYEEDFDTLQALAPQLRTFAYSRARDTGPALPRSLWTSFTSLEHLVVFDLEALPDVLLRLPNPLYTLRLRAPYHTSSANVGSLLRTLQDCPSSRRLVKKIRIPPPKPLARQSALAVNSQLLAEVDVNLRIELEKLCQARKVELEVLGGEHRKGYLEETLGTN